MGTYNNWREIWERKGDIDQVDLDLSDLLKLNGYDTAFSSLGAQSWIDAVFKIKDKLNLQAGQSLCEVGCGTGAFLYPLRDQGIELYGVDYAQNLVNICQQVLPEGTFAQAEASQLPFASNSFDAVVSNGVFLYFPDLDYATKAIEEMIRIGKSEAPIAILDINDAAKKEAFLKFRSGKIGLEKYQELYKNIPHLYCEKDWFVDVAHKHSYHCTIVDQTLEEYHSGSFRFNAFLEKK